MLCFELCFGISKQCFNFVLLLVKATTIQKEIKAKLIKNQQNGKNYQKNRH